MKVKTSELTGAALDWAVARCEGVKTWIATGNQYPHLLRIVGRSSENYCPSFEWSQGGPIIEREKIELTFGDSDFEDWSADISWHQTQLSDYEYQMCGPTVLIAAMRCWVASSLGNEVEVPAGLLP
jgi:hypothetical protein